MSFAVAPKLARYISDHSSPASRVVILGSEPEIYFYAHHHAASGYIYMYDLTSAAVRAAAMKREMFREIETVQIVYRWQLDAAGYSPASEVYICVYWRKP